MSETDRRYIAEWRETVRSRGEWHTIRSATASSPIKSEALAEMRRIADVIDGRVNAPSVNQAKPNDLGSLEPPQAESSGGTPCIRYAVPMDVQSGEGKS